MQNNYFYLIYLELSIYSNRYYNTVLVTVRSSPLSNKTKSLKWKKEEKSQSCNFKIIFLNQVCFLN